MDEQDEDARDAGVIFGDRPIFAALPPISSLDHHRIKKMSAAALAQRGVEFLLHSPLSAYHIDRRKDEQQNGQSQFRA